MTARELIKQLREMPDLDVEVMMEIGKLRNEFVTAPVLSLTWDVGGASSWITLTDYGAGKEVKQYD